MICHNSFQDYTIFHIILPDSFCPFFHSFPRISSVNKVKKSYCKECVCACVCLGVFLIFTENLFIMPVTNRPISAAGLSVCRRVLPCAVIINRSSRM